MTFGHLLSELSTLGDHTCHMCDFEHAFVEDVLPF
jgi:hypothetical protein